MRPLQIRKPTASQLRVVHRLLQEPLRPWQRRRAETLSLLAAGHPATDIARLLEVHVNTTYADLHAFAPVASPPMGQHLRLLRCPAPHRQGVWRTMFHAAAPPGTGPQPENPRIIVGQRHFLA